MDIKTDNDAMLKNSISNIENLLIKDYVVKDYLNDDLNLNYKKGLEFISKLNKLLPNAMVAVTTKDYENLINNNQDIKKDSLTNTKFGITYIPIKYLI